MSRARRLWQLVESYHAVIYFAPEIREQSDAAGLRGGWMSYFANRAAPMGPVPAGVVTATFYNFHPDMVRKSIPDAWSFATPQRVLEGRTAGMDAALRRVLGDQLATTAPVAALTRRAAEAARPDGRPIFAANADLPWPSEPHLELWHATTLLREHRGDGHVAALAAAGIDGCEAHVLQVAGGAVPREGVQPFRGWSDDEWAAAADRLRIRGWLDGDGRLTASGRVVRADVDTRTDAHALPPYAALGEDGIDDLETALVPLVQTVLAQNALPFPNPMGLPRP